MKITKINIYDELYPKRLYEISNFPKQLYILGNIELLNNHKTIAIVGSRECSEYGRKNAFDFASEFSDNGICVVSGMAKGIDASAHIGAIDKKGKTIAVLGSGFNYIYPKENEWLFQKILDNGGCIISEHPPEIEPDLNIFPKRNRIISGLSKCVLVVEAKHRSGSNITAKFATMQGKSVYAIPSNIDNKKWLGTNILIQKGAKLVINAKDIIESEFVDQENKQLSVDNGKINEIIKNKDYIEIYKVLSNKPTHINEIAKKLGKSVEKIMPILTMMELEDYIFQKQTNYFTI